MPQFDIYSFSSQLFWLVIVFGFLYFLISRYIAPKAESIFTKRASLLEENLNYAEGYNEKAKSLEKRRELKFEEVNSQMEDLYKEAFKLVELDFTNQKKELSALLDQKREKALAEIESYIDKFRTSKAAYSIKLAAFVIQKITNKDADIELLKEIQGKIK